MEQRLTLVSLGVEDLQRALRFYRDGLGWHLWLGSGGDFALFVLKGGVGLGLYPRHLLAADAGVADMPGFGGVTIAQNVADRAEVDALLTAAVAAGGVLLKPASEKPWGYTGYFADPDGHPWEIAYVPSLPLRNGMLAVQ
jgi:catechol 2,3-dioxygenase-like lactoylglutathione lyase family enzyme